MWTVAALIALSYLLGAVPFALLLGKFKGVDIRSTGSGNIGATNLTRTLGRPWGIAAFLLDFAKGLVPTLVALVAADSTELTPILAAIACGFAAILGHVFPIYLRFRGGKGVATSFGVMAALLPLPALVAAACWALLFLTTRIVSVASIVAAVAFPIATALLERGREAADYSALLVAASAAALLILARHHENIRRLIRGKESRF